MKFLDLGIVKYDDAYSIQRDTLLKRIGALTEDTALMLEHHPVITIGRLGNAASIRDIDAVKKAGIDIEYVDRGGDATYHAPGQLVIYPIVDLKPLKKDISLYIDTLELFLFKFFGEYGVKTEIIKGMRGSWVNGKKIASIGIGVKKWVTYHGVSINVDMDLAPFKYIRMCGYDDILPTSILGETGKSVLMEKVKETAKYAFGSAIRQTYGQGAAAALACQKVY